MKEGIVKMTRLKVIGLIFSLVLLTTLVGCNASEQSNSKGQTNNPSVNEKKSEKVVEIKLGNILAPTDPLNAGTDKFAELVKQKTNGSVEVKVFPASQLGTAPQQLEGVRLGSQDMFVGAMAWYEDMKGLENLRILGVPSAFDSNDHINKFLNSSTGKEMISTLEKNYGITLIVYDWQRPPRQVMARKAIKGSNELAGLKIRVPEQETWVGSWKALGANPTPISWSEIYTSLQQNVIEAVEAPVALIYSSKFQEQVKNLTLTNHTYMNIGVAINSKVWKSLSSEQQTALKEAAAEAGIYQNKLYEEAEKGNLAKLKEAGVSVYEVNRQEFFAPIENFVKEMEAKGKWDKGLWDQVRSLAE